MLIHSLEFVCINKPRAIPTIYTPYLSFNPVAVKRDEACDNHNMDRLLLYERNVFSMDRIFNLDRLKRFSSR